MLIKYYLTIQHNYKVLVNTLKQVYKTSQNNTHPFSVVHSQRREID